MSTRAIYIANNFKEQGKVRGSQRDNQSLMQEVTQRSSRLWRSSSLLQGASPLLLVLSKPNLKCRIEKCDKRLPKPS